MYMKDFITKEQTELFNTVLNLHYEIFGFDNDVFYLEDTFPDEKFEKYNNGMWNLLKDFGIEVIEGKAYFERKFYF